MANLIHEDPSRKIIAAAMKVSNTLRPGLGERLYENALVIELIKRGHRVNQQRAFPVFYEGKIIGKLVPDLIVDDLVIVDPKVVVDFTPDHVSQMIGYLSITQLKLEILLNFKYASLRWKRVVWEGGGAKEVADLADDAPPAL